MKFIELTNLYHHKVFINADAITSFQKSLGSNTEVQVGSQSYPIVVIESPEKILETISKSLPPQ